MIARGYLVALAVFGLPGCDDASRLEDLSNNESSETPTMMVVDRIEMTGKGARYTSNRNGAITQIDFAVPGDRIAPELAHFATPVGITDAGVVVMQDDYASRPVDGRCKDGVESFVRVFSLSERRELLAIPAVSCLEGVGADVTRVPTVRWVGGDQFRIEGQPERLFIIEGIDRVTELNGA